MLNQATECTTIMAPSRRCFEEITDFENYPSWASDIKHAKVLSRDSRGLAVDVEYKAAAMGRSTSYVLRYFYASDPLRLAWRLRSSDAVTRLDGEYEFKPVPVEDRDDPGDEAAGEATEVVYHLAVELVVPLPGFVKRRAETRIMHVALGEFKAHVEAFAQSRR